MDPELVERADPVGLVRRPQPPTVEVDGPQSGGPGARHVEVVAVPHVQRGLRGHPEPPADRPVGGGVGLGHPELLGGDHRVHHVPDPQGLDLGPLLGVEPVGQHRHPNARTVQAGHGGRDVVERRPAAPIVVEVVVEQPVELVVVAGGEADHGQHVAQPAAPLLARGDVAGTPAGEVALLGVEPGGDRLVVDHRAQGRKPVPQGRGGRAAVIEEGVVEVEDHRLDHRFVGRSGPYRRGRPDRPGRTGRAGGAARRRRHGPRSPSYRPFTWPSGHATSTARPTMRDRGIGPK